MKTSSTVCLLSLMVASTTTAFAPIKPVRPQHPTALSVRLPFLNRGTKETADSTANLPEITETSDQEESQQIQAQQTEIDASFAKKDETEEQSETQKLMQQVKDAGLAGVISYAGWELAFWFVSIPVVLLGYQQVTGHWPDLSDKEDIAKLSAEAFAFVNFARLAVPLRIGLALSTTPWIQNNVVDKFFNKEEDSSKDGATSPEE